MAGFGNQYDTPEDAAAAALMWLQQQPSAVKREYMGLLFQDPDTQKFFRGEFKTSNSRYTVDATFEPLGRLAGVVHNHPVADPGAKYPSTHYSDDDIKTANELGKVPSFIVAMDRTTRRGQERVFYPGKTGTYSRNEGARTKQQSSGEQFLAEFPIDEFKESIARRIAQSTMAPDIKARLIAQLRRQSQMSNSDRVPTRNNMNILER